MPAKKKIIFLYGFGGYKAQSKTAEKIFGKELIRFDYDSGLNQTIEEIARELRNFIEVKTTKNEKVNLIGISAGGIIASYYAKFISPKKVNKLATVCSPLHGAPLTKLYLSKRKGLKELSKDSAFLEKLNSKRLNKNRIINFYSYLDILVPGKSGKGENPRHTWNFFHFFIQNDKKILKQIKEFFKE